MIERLGPWIIDKELGRGGMGRVYLAHRAADAPPCDRFPGGQAAVKALAAELATDAGFQQRFQREVDALRQLDHPNIVRFYESGEDAGRYFYAMEYVPGQDYEQLLKAQGRLPCKEVLDMALQVCPALKHAHDRGIIHRDIKPQNLLRSEDGVVKLADFGVAKVFAGQHLTATGGLVGTAEFVSPEQAAGKPVTARSDLYSFGILLYTLVTGRVPFEGKTILDLMHKHRYAQPERPQRLVPELPHELDEVICSLLQKEPAERPANAQVLQRQLESIRRKLGRKEKATVATFNSAPTVADNEAEQADRGPGPATLASQLMREELARQNAPGLIGHYLNRAWVLVVLLALCVGVMVWGLWPANAEYLYEHGAALMEKDDVADWETAWDKYLTPLSRKYPDNPYQEKLQEFRQRLDEGKAERKAQRAASAGSVPVSEAQRFYLLGQHHLRDGDFAAARRTWENLVEAFQSVDSESRWVQRAESSLKDLSRRLPGDDRRWASVRDALEATKRMPRAEAEKVWKALEALYRDDPAAEPILRDVARQRAAATK